MRFLHIVQRYHPAIGGSERYMMMLSEGLVKAGHSVKVVTTTALEVDSLWRSDRSHVEKTDETLGGVSVHRIRPIYLPMHGKTMTLLSFLPGLYFKGRFAMPGPLLPGLEKIEHAAEDFDMVHACALPFTSLLWAAYRLARKRGKPLIYSPFMHLDIPDRLGYGYAKRYQIELLKKADAVIAQTGIEANALEKMGVDRERLRTIGIGLDVENYPRGNGARFRERHGIEEKIVFNLSARTYDKGAIHVVDAMKSLWEKGLKARLVMAGPARDDYIAHLNAQPDSVRERIVELGVIDDETKADAFDAADVFCMPSRSESFGIVYLESWLAGSPVVAARSGAVPEVVSDGVDGLLVDFGDVPALASAIERLILDDSLRLKMGEAGRAKVVEKYRWSDRFDAYMRIVDELRG